MWAGSDRIERVALDPAALGLAFTVSEVKGHGAWLLRDMQLP